MLDIIMQYLLPKRVLTPLQALHAKGEDEFAQYIVDVV
jgi:hypothetical protein